jgi:hypothetical protein
MCSSQVKGWVHTCRVRPVLATQLHPTVQPKRLYRLCADFVQIPSLDLNSYGGLCT